MMVALMRMLLVLLGLLVQVPAFRPPAPIPKTLMTEGGGLLQSQRQWTATAGIDFGTLTASR